MNKQTSKYINTYLSRYQFIFLSMHRSMSFLRSICLYLFLYSIIELDLFIHLSSCVHLMYFIYRLSISSFICLSFYLSTTFILHLNSSYIHGWSLFIYFYASSIIYIVFQSLPLSGWGPRTMIHGFFGGHHHLHLRRLLSLREHEGTALDRKSGLLSERM